MKAIVLLSGGIDSMACLHFYLNEGYDVDCVFCDYGQPAIGAEFLAAKSIADYFHVNLDIINSNKINVPKSGEIYGRNAFLVIQAFCHLGVGKHKIVLGIHGGVSYPDCSMVFLDAMNRIMDCYADGVVVVEAPFIDWRKTEIIDYCKNNKLPLDLTYSCEVGCVPPCGECLSCKDRREIHYE